MSSASRLALFFVLPAVGVMLPITVYPLLYGIWMAFTNYRVTHIRNGGWEYVGLQNFIDLLGGAPYLDFQFFSILGFNLLWAVSNVLFHVALGIALALLLHTPGLVGKGLYRTLLLLPWAVPTYITALVWKNLFDTQSGGINLLLANWGLPAVPWLEQFPQAYFALLMCNIWLGFPFMMMVASGGLQSIPKEMDEAAAVDGATPWQVFWKVTMPLLQPVMLPATVLGFIWTFNNFNVIYFVSGGGPRGMTEILVTQAYKLVNPLGLYGVAAAFAILIFLLLASMSYIQGRVAKA